MSEPTLASSKRTAESTLATRQPERVEARERHPIGDNCLEARIVGRQQISGNKARLLIGVPSGADVRVGGKGHVVGVPDSGFVITEMTDGFAVAHTYGRVDMAWLEGHTSAVFECHPTRSPTTKPVSARIIKREEIGRRIKITIGAGYAQGVFRDMTGHLTSPNGATFTVADVEHDNICYAWVIATHDELIQYPNVVIGP